MSIDPYEILGLTKAATAGDIKQAHRKLVRTSHPDLHPNDKGAVERFKAISAAYDLLKDPKTRARYDAGEIDAQGADRPQRQYYRDYADAPDNVYQQRRGSGKSADPGDFFAEILRNRASGGGRFDFGGQSASGQDVRYRLEVPFLDAVRGAETEITLPGGSSIAVKIPRGTLDGQTLRLRGKGARGFGDGPAGDALITVTVQDHPDFRRDGDNILFTLPVSFDDAILGAKVTVPTIDGPVGLTIAPGANSGSVLRLRGRGVKRAGSTIAGDQWVELKIVVPKAPDPELCDLLRAWRESRTTDPEAVLKKGATA